MANSTPTPTSDQQHAQTITMLNSIVTDRAKLRNLVDNRSDLCSSLMEDPEYAAILAPAIRAMDQADEIEALNQSADDQLAQLQALDSQPKPITQSTKPKEKRTNPDARKMYELSARIQSHAKKSAGKVMANYRRDSDDYLPGKEKAWSDLTGSVEIYCQKTGKIYQRIMLGNHQLAAIKLLVNS